MTYLQLLVALGADAGAIAVLAYAIYYRRHRRQDLALAFIALNAGVFAAVSLLSVERAGAALGFGLFGILSIVRLRSSAITQVEVGYYFVALTLGLVNGLGRSHPMMMATLDVVLLGVMFVLDRPRIGRSISHQVVVLDVVHPDRASLRADLERRLRSEVLYCTVTEVDYVRDVTVCEVRLRVTRRVGDRLPAVSR